MWQVLFWGGLALVLYVYIGYPAILYLAGRLRQKDPVRESDAGAPSVCLIISAFNEEKVIRQKIENSLALEYGGRLCIVVASDGSTDRTEAIARDYADVGVELHRSPERRGKNAVLNEVVHGRTEDVVVFTDANSQLASDAIARLADRLRDPSLGCVVGELKYARDVTSVGQGESLYWRYEALIKMLESRLKSVLVANGSIFAIRRVHFRDLFPDVANDFQAPFDVANQGRGTVYEPRALAVERSAEHWEEEFDRKVRIVMRGIAGFTRLRDRMRGVRYWQFVSHKLLRWCVGVFLVTVFAANVALLDQGGFYPVFLALQVACYAAALAGWRMRHRDRVPRVLYVPFYFTMVNWAALVALARFASGERQVVWQPAASTRVAAAVPADPSVRSAVAATTAEIGPRRTVV